MGFDQRFSPNEVVEGVFAVGPFDREEVAERMVKAVVVRCEAGCGQV